MGVIAQEVDAVFPELIERNEEGKMKVEYDGLVPPLMLAVKGLDERLDALGNQLDERSESRMTISDEEAGSAEPGESKATKRVAEAAGDELRTELDPDEIEKLFPELILTDEEGERTVAYEGLVGLLIEAVKELDNRVSEVEGRLD